MTIDRSSVEELLEIGDLISSGANMGRKNAATLEIVAFDNESLIYRSTTSKKERSYRLPYPHLNVLVEYFQQLDPSRIVESVNKAWENAKLTSDHITEAYAYGIAREVQARRNQDLLYPGESPQNASFQEGNRLRIEVERIERNRKARFACIQHFGAYCHVCGFDFGKVYGAIGKDFIHVHHHRQQLSSTTGKDAVNPINDLVPLCANCHAMIHRRKQMLTLEEIRNILLK